MGRISLSHDLLNMLGLLELGNIPEGEGREIVIFVEARGRNKQLELDRVEAIPPFLQVELRPGVNSATSGLHRLHFKIPADAPQGSYSGASEGQVTLHFTDGEYPPVTFRPSFFITRD